MAVTEAVGAGGPGHREVRATLMLDAGRAPSVWLSLSDPYSAGTFGVELSVAEVVELREVLRKLTEGALAETQRRNGWRT